MGYFLLILSIGPVLYLFDNKGQNYAETGPLYDCFVQQYVTNSCAFYTNSDGEFWLQITRMTAYSTNMIPPFWESPMNTPSCYETAMHSTQIVSHNRVCHGELEGTKLTYKPNMTDFQENQTKSDEE